MRFLHSVACLFLITHFAFAAPLKNIVVFGDSLSDNGNLYEYMHHQLPQSPPYYEGRFSNGPVWAETLVKSYFKHNPAAHLLDYAFGGAGVFNNISDDDEDTFFTLGHEIDTYLLAHNGQASPDSLFVVWIGGNNYLSLPEEKEETVLEVTSGIEKGLKRIIDAGAKHILVMSLPDIGATPLARELEAPDAFTTLSELHNQQLTLNMQQLKQTYPQVHWMFFDTDKSFKEILAHAAQYSIENTQENCYDALLKAPSKQAVFKIAASIRPNNMTVQDCNKYFFFDLLHPTERVHTITAQYIRALLDKENITFVE